ncbi:hypothetical protein Leryth_024406 [Lithospermum erythrorhizon]|nr:hypothetical protein Leryth_024406 [Lithospermum erythrorhizon]
MQNCGNHSLLILLFLFSSLSSIRGTFPSTSLSSSFSASQQITLQANGDLPKNYEYQVQINYKIDNPRLKRGYIALQAWKKSILSDPSNFTSNWDGPDVCKYNGVFCAPAPDDSKADTVAGIDLNRVDIAGDLPAELGLLTDVSILHLNSNRFHGVVPKCIYRLKLIRELDLSNNNFVGPFPEEVLALPNLKYLDLRFNSFEGELPSQLFDKELDALFLNDNRFTSKLPDNFGNSSASVMVLANNQLEGPIPTSVGKMANTLDELVLFNNKFNGCLSSEIGFLGNASVVDLENNSFSGTLPVTLKGLETIETLNLAYNNFTGFVPDNICGLPKLVNFTFAYNYFNGEALSCVPTSRKDVALDDTSNCLPQRPNQKSHKECVPVVTNPIDCGNSEYEPAPQPSPSEESEMSAHSQMGVESHSSATSHAEFSFNL